MSIKHKRKSEKYFQAKPGRSLWVLFPPPFLFASAFLVGIGIGKTLPLAIIPLSIYSFARILGIVFVVMAGLTMVSAVLLFATKRTTLIPHGTARSFVVEGPFRLTRNPMYLGFIMGYLGFAIIVNIFWVLPLLAFPLWVIQTKTIPHEEKNLTRIFGKSYRLYQLRVRRWL